MCSIYASKYTLISSRRNNPVLPAIVLLLSTASTVNNTTFPDHKWLFCVTDVLLLHQLKEEIAWIYYEQHNELTALIGTMYALMSRNE